MQGQQFLSARVEQQRVSVGEQRKPIRRHPRADRSWIAVLEQREVLIQSTELRLRQSSKHASVHGCLLSDRFFARAAGQTTRQAEAPYPRKTSNRVSASSTPELTRLRKAASTKSRERRAGSRQGLVKAFGCLGEQVGTQRPPMRPALPFHESEPGRVRV